MGRQAILGEFEQLVLLAILGLGHEASGSRISRTLERKAARRVSRGALYSALDRLEAREFITWRLEGSTPARGGHPSRIFSLQPAGLDALRRQQQALGRLRDGLEDVLGLERA